MNKENTFRALADKPLIADRWRCKFNLHRWSNWSVPEKDNIAGRWRQYRSCVDCNRHELIKLKDIYE